MKVERIMEIETNDIHVYDRIHVGKYTATCLRTTKTSRRPVFQISMRNEDTMTQDTTKKSAPENEETIRDVLNVLGTFNDKQRLVLNYLVDKAVEDAKKGKTSESDGEDE